LSVALLVASAGSAFGQFDVSWWTVDGGGNGSTGGGFEVTGTIGQADAGGTMTGGGFELTGGFWPGVAAPAVLAGDVNCDGLVNNGDIDAFVLALTDAPAYAATYPGCDILAADVNGDGLVNNGDIDAFVALLTGG
jgi:hypothetical protein